MLPSVATVASLIGPMALKWSFKSCQDTVNARFPTYSLLPQPPAGLPDPPFPPRDLLRFLAIPPIIIIPLPPWNRAEAAIAAGVITMPPGPARGALLGILVVVSRSSRTKIGRSSITESVNCSAFAASTGFSNSMTPQPLEHGRPPGISLVSSTATSHRRTGPHSARKKSLRVIQEVRYDRLPMYTRLPLETGAAATAPGVLSMV
mmetsp:Transcript_54840/g.146665  ORF Transcript_54840/g.146665 Transcript_54840/m.146665 type:complete len:205 (+) Transcript_54840:206-820(+)